MENLKPWYHNAHRTDWAWSKNERANERYPKWNKNIQGTNSDTKETRAQSNDLKQKEEINIQLDQNEETRIKKSEERLTNIWDSLKHSNIRIIGVTEGEEQEQEVENLLERIRKTSPIWQIT